ncbi:MAG: hypothetical protein ACKVOJ_05950 [Sphingomonadaceae bacterium]
MRKIFALSLVTVAALSLAACGTTPTAAPENGTVTEVNAADAMEGTSNDAMTNVDAAVGADNNMAADVNAAAANTTAAVNTTDAAANAAAPAENAAK